MLEVYPNQPAAQAGLAAGDVVTEIDGRRIRTMDDMLGVLDGKPPGTKLPFTIQRDGAAQKLAVTLGRRPQEPGTLQEDLPVPDQPPPLALPGGPKLGVRTIPVTVEVQRQNALPNNDGAQVVSVGVDSAAAQAGIPLGAVITGVNGQPIRTPQELAAAIQNVVKSEVRIAYVQSGRKVEATATLDVPAAGDGPQLETRARPPQPSPLSPAELQPALPTGDAESRIDALERRVRELEARINSLEGKATVE